MNEQPAVSNPSLLNMFDAREILDSLPDGAYVTDNERRIVFWSRAAQRITGWPADEVVGRTCYDNVLVHVDKDGHALCGHEHCPLHRSIVTGQPSLEPVLLFSQHRLGTRIPVEVSVAPIRSKAGEVIGGIEVFRDLSESMLDQLQARNIQYLALNCALTKDERVSFETRYEPRDIVGGDFYQIERLSADQYAVLVADAMGHGVAAALCTMQLRSLWNDHRAELTEPAAFVEVLNERLHLVVDERGYFGTAVYALYDAASGQLRCVRAGHPAPLLFRTDGTIQALGCSNPALGLLPKTPYRESAVQLEPGDAVLLFTDGATELFDAGKRELGAPGLGQLVRAQGEGPRITEFRLEKLEEQLLRFTNQIHLPDDLAMVKLHRLS